MDWGTCKLVTVQTMFSNEGKRLTIDDINQDYIDAMPGKANEAMHQIAEAGRPILRQFTITLEADAEEAQTEDSLLLPTGDVLYKIQLTDYIPTFRAVDRLMLERGDVYAAFQDYSIEGDTVLVLPGRAAGEFTLWYKAYPAPITAETPDEYELELPPDAVSLVPLYMASALYMDDDLSMATMLRNQYEVALQRLREAYAATGNGYLAGTRRNTTGWW